MQVLTFLLLGLAAFALLGAALAVYLRIYRRYLNRMLKSGGDGVRLPAPHRVLQEDVEAISSLLLLDKWKALYPWQTDEVPDSEAQLMTVYLGDDYELYLYEGHAVACYTDADTKETDTAYYSFPETVTEALQTYLSEDFGTRLIFPEDSTITTSEPYLLLNSKEQITLSKLGNELGWGYYAWLHGYKGKRVNFEELLEEDVSTMNGNGIIFYYSRYHNLKNTSNVNPHVITLNDGWECYLYEGRYHFPVPADYGAPFEEPDYYEVGDYYVLVIGQEGSRDCFYFYLQNYTVTEAEGDTDEDEKSYVTNYFHEGDEAYVSCEEMLAFAEALYVQS